jgi:hypothetical protein
LIIFQTLYFFIKFLKISRISLTKAPGFHSVRVAI